MNDFIILEGCNGVGKTTLAKMLLHYGYKLLHFDYDPNLSIMEKYKKILATDYKSNVVLDRSFISEMVYGVIMRGESRFSDSDFSTLLRMVKKRNGRVVLLDASPEIIFERIKKRKKIMDKGIDLKMVKRISGLYREVLSSRQECTVIIIKNDKENPKDTFNKILI